MLGVRLACRDMFIATCGDSRPSLAPAGNRLATGRLAERYTHMHAPHCTEQHASSDVIITDGSGHHTES